MGLILTILAPLAGAYLVFYGIRDGLIRKGALKYQVQHFWEKMLHGKNLHAVEY